MEDTTKDRVIDAKEAAKILGMHEKTVRNLLQQGKLPGKRFGRSWRLLESAVYKLIPTNV